MIFGKQDTHVPREGRDLIRKELEAANVIVSVRVRPDPRSVYREVLRGVRLDCT